MLGLHPRVGFLEAEDLVRITAGGVAPGGKDERRARAARRYHAVASPISLQGSGVSTARAVSFIPSQATPATCRSPGQAPRSPVPPRAKHRLGHPY